MISETAQDPSPFLLRRAKAVQLDPWAAGAVGAETQPGGRGTYTPIVLSELDQEALAKYEQDPEAAQRFLNSNFKKTRLPSQWPCPGT